MNAAEFDTRRRLLGLSIQETADYVGAQRRTVERWISGAFNVSESAIERLQGLEDQMNEAVETVLQQTNILSKKHGNADEIKLIRYASQETLDASPHATGMPLGSHAIMIGWTADALEAQGWLVVIDWDSQ